MGLSISWWDTEAFTWIKLEKITTGELHRLIPGLYWDLSELFKAASYNDVVNYLETLFKSEEIYNFEYNYLLEIMNRSKSLWNNFENIKPNKNTESILNELFKKIKR